MTAPAVDPNIPAPSVPDAPGLLMGPDGQVYKATPDKAVAAMAAGYRPLTPDEQLKHSVAKEEGAKGIVGSLEQAGESGLNQLLLGVPGAIQDETETPEEKAHRQAVEEYHSTARLLGGALGFGGSMLAGGEVFKAADMAGQAVARGILPAEELGHATLAAKLAATSANYATQGALLASPQAIVQAAWGDPQKAAETLLWGVGAGAALGGLGELVGAAGGAAKEGAEALAEHASTPDAVTGVSPAEQFASDRTAKAFGAERSQLNKLSPERIRDVTAFAHDEGIIQPGMSRSDLGAAVDAAKVKYGGAMDEAIKGLDGAVKEGAKPEVMAAALKPGDLGDAIRQALDSPELEMEMHADERNALGMVVRDANKLRTTSVDGQEVVSFDAAQNFVSDLRSKWTSALKRAQNQGGVKGMEAVTPLDQMKAAAYQVAKDALHTAGDDVAKASGNLQLEGALAEAKMKYSKVAELDKWAATLERQSAGNRMVGLTDWISMGQGPAANAGMGLGAGIGGAIGGIPGAAIGGGVGKVAGGVLDFIGKKWGEDRGLVYLSAIARKAAKEGPEVFSAIMGIEAKQRLSATMDAVQGTVRDLAKQGIEATAASGSEHMKHLLGSTQGLTPDQAYQKLGSRLTAMATNPAAMAAATSQLSAPYSSTAPAVSDAYTQKMAETVQYLYNALPKAPGPPPPFAPQNWSPSQADKLAFHDRAEIVANPMRAMQRVTQGTLSDAHLDTLRTIYPTIYGMMRQQILTYSAEHPHVKLPLQERSSIAKFLGQPLDTMDDPQRLRAMASQQPASQPLQSAKPKPMASGKLSHMPSSGTTFSATQAPALET